MTVATTISRTFNPLIFKCKLGLLLLQYTSIHVHVAARHMSKNVLYKLFPSILPNSLVHEWYLNTFKRKQCFAKSFITQV